MIKMLEFDHRHYVPILKTKGGELDALRSLSARQTQAMTPVFEVHPGKMNNPVAKATPKKVPKPIASQAADIFEDLASVPIAQKPFFLDTMWFYPKNPRGDADAIATTFQAARTAGLKPIPVVRAGYSAETLRQLRQEIRAGSGECMFRIRALDLYRPVQPIDSMLGAVGLSADSVHFLLDYGEVPMQLASDLSLIPMISDWRTLTSSAGAFPKSLSKLSKFTWHRLPRTDWMAWKAGLASGRESRQPTYGDYACRFPGEPPEGGSPGVNLRYAFEDEWLVQTGGSVLEGQSRDMAVIHEQLIAIPEFFGAFHCDGDTQYAVRIPPNHRYGSAQNWVQWSVTHHLVHALQQLAAHSWL